MDWKLAILEGLRLRNQRESGGFTELITSRECAVPFTAVSLLEGFVFTSIFCTFTDSKIQDQLETIRKEVTRLTYLKNELETVPTIYQKCVPIKISRLFNRKLMT